MYLRQMPRRTILLHSLPHLVIAGLRTSSAECVGNRARLQFEDRKVRSDLMEQPDAREPGKIGMEGEGVKIEMLRIHVQRPTNLLVEVGHAQLITGPEDHAIDDFL